jgi:transcriptional regulator with XRE-family HTH domain
MITAAQCRAARALLDWSQQRLAEASKVGNATIRNFESGRSKPVNSTLAVLRHTLEAAGIEFLDENGNGVKLAKAKPGPIPIEDLNASNDE